MRIVIAGPATPSVLLSDEDSRQEFPAGMGGPPVNDLVRALLDLGHDVVLVSGSNDIQKPWRLTEGRLQIRLVPFRIRARDRALDGFRLERKMLTEEIDDANGDIVHAHWTYEFALAAIKSKSPHIISIHDAPLSILRLMFDPYRIIRTLMAYRVRLHARSLIAVSPYVAYKWKRQMLDPKKIRVIPNLVPPLRRRSENPQESKNTDKLTILDVSNATPLKNVKILIDAMRLVNRTHPLVVLNLVGPGLDADGEFARHQRNIGPLNFVNFLGSVSRNEIERHLSRATIFCHPSLEESFGMSALEAMKVGVPIVAARQAGGIRWLTHEGRAGLLFDGRDAEQLSVILTRLLENEDLRNGLIDSAYFVVENEFSTSKIIADLENIYQDAVRGQVRRTSANRW